MITHTKTVYAVLNPVFDMDTITTQREDRWSIEREEDIGVMIGR